MILFRIIKESFLFAINSLKTNRLRTILSLLGITIGIFAIISVFTVIDSLEIAIHDSVSELGDDVVYVQKWPWEFSPDYAWWEYIKRPVPSVEEYEAIKERSGKMKSCTFMGSAARTVSYGRQHLKNTPIIMASHDYAENRAFDISDGRYFSLQESNHGQNVCVIGSKVAEDIFPRHTSAIRKDIKIAGRKTQVVGVFAKEGEDMLFSTSHDEVILIPLNYARSIFDIRSDNINPMIMVTAHEDVSVEELIDELTVIMRSERRIEPIEESDFALNKASMISRGLDKIFKTIDMAGILIGGFAILVGGFGIANIMFVSVKERTRQIGIQKAIGAKNIFILAQFLFEAIVLCLIGGMVGLILIWLGAILGTELTDFKIILTSGNIILGLSISAIIGIIFGFAPARAASKMDPVEAMSQA